MKKTTFTTRKYFAHLIAAILLLIFYVGVYGAGLVTHTLILTQELALTFVIIGLISNMAVDSYCYVCQCRYDQLRSHNPHIYYVDLFLTSLFAVSACYYETTVCEGLLYWVFAIIGSLIAFSLVVNAIFIAIAYVLTKLIKKGE